jgi:hypothetical protein
MKRLFAAFAVLISLLTAALAASGREPAPAGALSGAPAQYTRFSTPELMRGFLALAFGSDLRIGAAPRGTRRLERPIRAAVVAGGSVDRTAAMQRVIVEYADKVPGLHLRVVEAKAAADIEVRLIDEKNFTASLRLAFGTEITRAFITRTDPQCMTSVKSDRDGAYHELLHAFGLSNHDQRNPRTTLNQHRMAGYLSVYDRSLLTVLYDMHIRPGMTAAQARAVLPA